jgi:hypothetical protein
MQTANSFALVRRYNSASALRSPSDIRYKQAVSSARASRASSCTAVITLTDLSIRASQCAGLSAFVDPPHVAHSRHPFRFKTFRPDVFYRQAPHQSTKLHKKTTRSVHPSSQPYRNSIRLQGPENFLKV